MKNNSDHFLETLKAHKEKIYEEMKQYLQVLRENEKNLDPFLDQALQDIEEVILTGGKRVRGALLITGYLAAGGKNIQSVYRAAAGVEFIHSFLLVHDDIMDRDELRHGVSTLHHRYKLYAEKFFPHLDAAHFGNSQAIIFGDMLNAWGNDCIYSVNIAREQVQLAIQKMQKVVYKTGIGQMRDMYYEYRGKATENEVLSMYEDKTARYTLEAPLHMGVLLAGGGEKLMDIFTRYSLPLGVAFQLQDDILGIFGDSKETGKKNGSDIEKGKLTYLFLRTVALSAPEESDKLLRLFQNAASMNEDEKKWVRQKIQESGAVEEAQQLIRKNIDTAEKILEAEKEHLDSETFTFLQGMAEYMFTRKN